MNVPAQHTPGPWERHAHAYADTIQSVGGSCVCSLLDGIDKTANARLIAAAPELLAELERTEASLTAILCSRVVDSTTSTWLELRRDRDAARAAIARATGGNAS